MVVGVTAVLAFGLGPVVLLFVKKDPIYSQFLPALWILIVSQAAITVGLIPHYALHAHHKDRDVARWSAVSMVSALLCYGALVPTLGMYGACIGSLVSSVVIWLGKEWAAGRERRAPSVER